MTTLPAAAASGRRTLATTRAAVWSQRDLLALLLALVVWALPVTHDTGGRGGRAMALALAALLPALAVIRPWRRCPRLLTALAVATSAGAVASCLLSPAGWSGADTAAGYVLAAWLFACVWCVGGTPARRLVLAAGVALAGAEQFARAWLPWWGGGHPQGSMIGTFYWHNPFAAWMVAAGCVAAALAVGGRTQARAIGWVAAPLAVTAVVLSTSRASMACLAVGWIAVAVLLRHRPGALWRWALLSGAAVGTLLLVTSPLVLDHGVNPFGATAQRASSGETLGANGGYRLEFWWSALVVFARYPLAGCGPHLLARAASGHVPSGWALSPLAHNGYLQALADGGVLLALPFLLACAVVSVALVRRLWRFSGSGATEPARVGAGLAAAALLAHSAVDFDWSYPSLLVMTAVTASIALCPDRSSAPEEPGGGTPTFHRRMPGVGPGLAVGVGVWALVGLALVGAGAMARTTDRLAAAGGSDPVASARAVSAAGARLLPDPRPDERVVELGAAGRLPGNDPDLRAAVARTARLAALDIHFEVRRLYAVAVTGDPAGAAARVRGLRDAGRLTAPGDLDAAAAVLAVTGAPDEARALLEPVSVGDTPAAVAHREALQRVLRLADGTGRGSGGASAEGRA